MKHNHHTESSLLCKFVRRGVPQTASFSAFPEVKGKFPKKEVVAICMESPLYFLTPRDERNNLVKRLSI